MMQMAETWGRVRRSMAVGLAAGGLLFLFPLALVKGEPAQDRPAVLPPSPVAVTASAPPSPSPAAGPGADGARTVRVLLEDGTVEEQTMADYLWSVTAAEMPASFEPEALRAQAVCARTYTLWQMRHPGKHERADVCTDSGCCQAYITREAAAERWGPLAETYEDKLEGAVADTSGIAALYDGAPIQAVFFSSAAGKTEDAAAVWGSELPYLTSVESPEGEEVPNYRSTVTYTADELRELVLGAYPQADLSGPPADWLSDVAYTGTGRVETIKVGGVVLSGGAARSLFALRSPSFTVDCSEGGFTFSVTGYGHGVGLSQYGANAMAKAGSTWREILEHYYTGVELGQV